MLKEPWGTLIHLLCYLVKYLHFPLPRRVWHHPGTSLFPGIHHLNHPVLVHLFIFLKQPLLVGFFYGFCLVLDTWMLPLLFLKGLHSIYYIADTKMLFKPQLINHFLREVFADPVLECDLQNHHHHLFYLVIPSCPFWLQRFFFFASVFPSSNPSSNRSETFLVHQHSTVNMYILSRACHALKGW